MLVNIQKKLDQSVCPSCGKKHVLQASLVCNRDDKECVPVAHCIECGLSLLVRVPSEFDRLAQDHDVTMTCDITTSACNIEVHEIRKAS